MLKRAGPLLPLVWAFVSVSAATTAQRVDPAPMVAALASLERGVESPPPFSMLEEITPDHQSAAKKWIDAAPVEQRAHRREVVAFLVLQVGLNQKPLGRGFEVLEFACGLLRSGPPTEFEQVWQRWVAARLDFSRARAYNYQRVFWHRDHASERFPNDGRLRLATLLDEPELFHLSNRPGAGAGKIVRTNVYSPALFPGRQVENTLGHLRTLESDSEVDDEARMRVGLLQFHLNDLGPSIASLRSAAATSTDPYVQNLASLVAGLALQANGDTAGASGAYELANRAMPGAKAAATALAVQRFLAGNREEAAALLDAAYLANPPSIDPWRHPTAIYRFAPGYVNQLRRFMGLSRATVVGEPDTAKQAIDDVPSADDSMAAGNLVDASTEAHPRQQPAFRAAALAVAVDVSVRSGRIPVTGLRVEDFELLDNGVPQTMSSLALETIPLDVSIVLDLETRYFVLRPGPVAVDNDFEDARAIAQSLRPTDRIRLLLTDCEPWEVVPLQNAGLPVPAYPFLGGSRPRDGSFQKSDIFSRATSFERSQSTFDGIARTLLDPTPIDRRQVILVLSNGEDDASILSGDKLLAVAQQSDAVVYFGRRVAPPDSVTSKDHRLWPLDGAKTVRSLVQLLGGGEIALGLGTSIAKTFQRILDDFGQRYLLRYQPRGVAAGGWHNITVRLKDSRKLEIKARRGYFGG